MTGKETTAELNTVLNSHFLGFALINVATDGDNGNGPTWKFDVWNGRPLNPSFVKQLWDNWQGGAALKKEIADNALTACVAKEYLAKPLSPTAENAGLVKWTSESKSGDQFILLNGKHRIHTLKTYIIEPYKQYYNLVVKELSKSSAANRAASLQKVKEAEEELYSRGLWLVKLYDWGIYSSYLNSLLADCYFQIFKSMPLPL